MHERAVKRPLFQPGSVSEVSGFLRSRFGLRRFRHFRAPLENLHFPSSISLPPAFNRHGARWGMDSREAELIQRWQRGEEAAFEEIVRRWQQPIGRFLCRLTGNSETATDL